MANGDEAETGFYLSLQSPICTVGDGGADQVPFDSVREIQLVLNKKQYAILRPKLGNIVTLQGNIFSAFTGHHHADVLMRVSNRNRYSIARQAEHQPIGITGWWAGLQFVGDGTRLEHSSLVREAET